MKSPTELALKLRRQWDDASSREDRLLRHMHSWPIAISIGRPPPNLVAFELDRVKSHIEKWRNIGVGEVVWEAISYRATSSPVEIPVQWKIREPSEWVDACADRLMRSEYNALSVFVEQTDPLFHPILIRRRSLWRTKALEEVVQAARLAMALEPGCANGKPLRTLSLDNIDTKFFERNASLVTTLLDIRYDGEVSQIGLETFLDATSANDHWLLVIDLDGTLLPFKKQRIRSSELRDTGLPGERLLIVENECCQHQVVDIPQTIAVFGAGFDLCWTDGHWLELKKVGYWGDIDTWGLQLLAMARSNLEHLDPLLMTADVYDQHISSAVPEPVVAGVEVPTALNEQERLLYKRLLEETRGRLEQEFLPEPVIRDAIVAWANS